MKEEQLSSTSMARTKQPQVIIITGPVGAGKSTTSQVLAQSLRRPDLAVAVIDLDQMYGFVRQQDGYGEPSAWVRARQGAAALATCWFSSGVSIVIVEGEFFNAEEVSTLTTAIARGIECSFFTLQLTYDSALGRVQGDPSRGASKDPVFLKSLHAHFAQALPFLEEHSMVITTDELTAGQVAARIVAALDRA